MKKYLSWNGQILGRGGRYFTPGVRIRPNYIYGLLYNWYAASDSRIGNSGFGVPTDAEWTAMTNYVNATYNVAPNDFGVGNHLKSCRQVSSPLGGDCATLVHPRWNSNATEYGRDTLKFGLLPGGLRSTAFGSIGIYIYLWSKTEYSTSNGYMRYAISSYLAFDRWNSSKLSGFGIRLSRPATPSELLIPEGQILPSYYKGNNNFLYDCVRINDRIWLAQNLAETKWSDGTDIPFAGSNGVNFSNAEWAALTTPGVCAYDNNLNYAYSIGDYSYLLGGKTFYYNEVTNPITGRVWMDRNLGAFGPATALDDELAYGDLFQWGRLADGHQSRESFTRSEQSTGDVPGHGDFIIGFNDWRNPSNDNLWQGVDAINSVAPKGWRLPTQAEWEAEQVGFINNITDAYNSFLKIPYSGIRIGTGAIVATTAAYYWTQTTTSATTSWIIGFRASDILKGGNNRRDGMAVRLIKDI